MLGTRQSSLKALAEAVVADPNLFLPFGTIEETTARLRTIRGVGEWTANILSCVPCARWTHFLRLTSACSAVRQKWMGYGQPRLAFSIAPSHGDHGAPTLCSTSGPLKPQ